MSFVRTGCAAATMDTYVTNAEVHMCSDLTSLVSGALAVVEHDRNASRCSARAILLGRSSCISMNCKAWAWLELGEGARVKGVVSMSMYIQLVHWLWGLGIPLYRPGTEASEVATSIG